MKRTLRLLVKMLIGPRSLMEEVRRRGSLSILLVCPILAILIMISPRANNFWNLPTSLRIGSILVLCILIGGCLLVIAGVMYTLSKLGRRDATITYLSFVSGIAFTIVPLICRNLLMTLFPFLSKSTAAGNRYFVLSMGALLDTELESSVPLLFRIAAFELEPFALWNFLLWIFLINVFFEIKMWKSVCIAVLLSIPAALLPF
jgi:hypothetical protein